MIFETDICTNTMAKIIRLQPFQTSKTLPHVLDR